MFRVAPLIRVCGWASLAFLVFGPTARAWDECKGDVDLQLWTAEDYPLVGNLLDSLWTPSDTGDNVVQSWESPPSMFISDLTDVSYEITGRVRVVSAQPLDVSKPNEVRRSACEFQRSERSTPELVGDRSEFT